MNFNDIVRAEGRRTRDGAHLFGGGRRGEFDDDINTFRRLPLETDRQGRPISVTVEVMSIADPETLMADTIRK